MEPPRVKRPYAPRRKRSVQLADVWFGKTYSDLSQDEMRIYMRRYRHLQSTGAIGTQKDESYINVIRIKKYAKRPEAEGGGTLRQRIQCSCGRSVVTTYTGYELELHKTRGIHRRLLGNNPDRSIASTIDRQWDFTDDDLLEGILVKKPPTLQDFINELD
jgi:hypothetical protein